MSNNKFMLSIQTIVPLLINQGGSVYILFAICFWKCNHLRLLFYERKNYSLYFLMGVNDHVTFHANYKIPENDEQNVVW